MKKIFILAVACVLMLTAASALALTEDDYYGTVEELPVGLSEILPPQYAYVDGMKSGDYSYLLMAEGNAGRRLLIFGQDDGSYSLTCESTLLTRYDGLDAGISYSGTDTISVDYQGEWYGAYGRNEAGEWAIRWITSTDNIGFSQYLGMYTHHFTNPNQLLFYPGTQTFNLAEYDTATLPHTWEDAVKMQDTTGFAKVHNTDPAKRLNLRTQPSEDAQSIGRYYNGTPVQVLSAENGWARVSIAGLEGYVATASLTYGEKMLDVESAFPRFSPTMADFDAGIALREEPSLDATITAVLADEDYDKRDVLVLAEADNGFYHVLCSDDTTGYVEAKHIR